MILNNWKFNEEINFSGLRKEEKMVKRKKKVFFLEIGQEKLPCCIRRICRP